MITGVGTVIVRLTAFDAAVPVFAAVTDATPTFAIRLAGTDAVS